MQKSCKDKFWFKYARFAILNHDLTHEKQLSRDKPSGLLLVVSFYRQAQPCFTNFSQYFKTIMFWGISGPNTADYKIQICSFLNKALWGSILHSIWAYTVTALCTLALPASAFTKVKSVTSLRHPQSTAKLLPSYYKMLSEWDIY